MQWYASGKTLVVADTLSRSPLASTHTDAEMQNDVACHVASVVGGIPASTNKMDEIRAATAADHELRSVARLIKKGWPEHLADVPVEARGYVPLKSEL